MVRCALVFLLMAVSAAALRADTLVFTNGDQLSGSLQRADGSHLMFNSAMAGNLNVPWSKVKSLSTTKPFIAVTESDKVLRGPIKATPPQIHIDGTALKLAQLRMIVNPDIYTNSVAATFMPWQGWHGQMSGGFSQVSATQNSISYNASIDISRPTPQLAWLPQRSDTVLHLQEAYGKLTAPNQPTVRTSIFTGSLEQDQDLTPQLFVFGNAEFDHNYAQGLQLQQAYGAGLGWKIFHSAGTRLDVKADLHWTDQRFLSAARETFLASSFSENFRQNFGGRVIWTQNVSVTPSYTNGLAYQMAGMTSWAVPVYKAFSLNFTVADNYLNNPQPGFLKNSLQISTGVQYTLF